MATRAQDVTTSIRLPRDLMRRVEQAHRRFAAADGLRRSKADTIRRLIARGLEAEERKP